MRHYEENIVIAAPPKEIFGFIDDHARFSSHMNQSSWMMGGGRMETAVDEGRGYRIGSHIRMSGKAFGIPLSLDEVIIKYEPPYAKEWETVGSPKLIVVGYYKMFVGIKERDGKSLLRVSIDYELPQTNAWLGKLFGSMYAKWCVQQMINGVKNNFKHYEHR